MPAFSPTGSVRFRSRDRGTVHRSGRDVLLIAQSDLPNSVSESHELIVNFWFAASVVQGEPNHFPPHRNGCAGGVLGAQIKSSGDHDIGKWPQYCHRVRVHIRERGHGG